LRNWTGSRRCWRRARNYQRGRQRQQSGQGEGEGEPGEQEAGQALAGDVVLVRNGEQMAAFRLPPEGR
jgi:hypothetical protein